MKLSVAIVAAVIAFVAAQDSLNECEQRCVTAMQGQSSQLGCSDGDAVCLCANQNFTNGLRDCGAEACGSDRTLSFAATYCKGVAESAASSIAQVTSQIASATSAAAATTSSDSMSQSTGSDSKSESAKATTTVTSSQGEETVTTSVTSTAVGGGNATGIVGGNVPISTLYSVSAVVDGSSTQSVQTLGSSTVYSSISDATPVSTQTNGDETTTIFGTGSDNKSSSAVTTSAIVSTVTNESTTFETTVGSSTISKEAAQSTLTDENGNPTSTSEAAGARQTAGAAFMAVVGLAALVL